MLVWDDGSVTISNIFRGSCELNKDQVSKFVELWEQTVKEHEEGEI
jgi:DNA-binding XRE family transcriptional regulator